MYGLIFVEPAGGWPKVDREFYVMQSEFYTKQLKGTEGLTDYDRQKALDENPTYVVFNGRLGSLMDTNALKAKVGETVRIYFGNAGPNKTSGFHVIGAIFEKVFREGDVSDLPAHNIQTTAVPPGGAAVMRTSRQIKVFGALGLAFAMAATAKAVEWHPYGFLMTSYLQEWGRPNNIELPSQSPSAGTTAAGNQNVSAFTARQSRIGANFSGGKGPGNSDLGGVLEMDFDGLRNTGASNLDVLASAPRLRLAYIQAKQDDHAFIFGQDWIKAFAPLNPVSILHTAIPALSNSGNLWNRIPQLRWDAAWALSNDWGMNTKLAIVRSFSGDETGRTTTAGGTSFAVPTSVDSAGSGEFSGGPAYQALAEAQKKIAGRMFLVGVSAQYLRESFNAAEPPPAGSTNNKVAGWLWAAHFDLPILERLDLSGEGFYGHGDQNQNGLGAVYNDLGTIRLSQVRGGWSQVTLKCTKTWRVNAMAGFEGVDQTGLAAGTIYRNETVASNVMWDVSPEMTLSVEFGRIHSYYVSALAGDSENLGLAVQYKF